MKIGARKILAIGGAAALTALVFWVWFVSANRPIEAAPVPLDRVVKGRDAAIHYLITHQARSGRFDYLIHPARGPKKKRYNWLRHAGAVYALSMAYRQTPSPDIRDSMVRAAKYLHTRMRPLEAHPRAWAVWSRGKRDEPREVAKLGGAGLALLALCELEKIAPATTSKEMLRGLGEFIGLMQKEAGDFHSKYADGGPHGDWESLYYPGEAIFGILALDDVAPDARWKEMAQKGLAYYAHSRSWQLSVPPDHWMLIAIAAYFGKTGGMSEKERALHLGHAEQIMKGIMGDQVTDVAHPAFGAFSSTGKLTPASTRLEGLLAAAPLFDPVADKKWIERVHAAIHGGLGFVLEHQITAGALKGGIPRAAGPFEPPDTPKEQTFADRAEEVRVDYVQHALSAMIGYIDLFYASDKAGD